MGGKTSTSTNSTTIPPAVLAQYSAVNARANQTANTPFQTYGGEFVAPVNSQQQAGIAGVNQEANAAQPYYGAATSAIGAAQSAADPLNAAAAGVAGNAINSTQPINNQALGLASASAGAVNPSDLNAASINKYLSPYLGDVLGSESALLNQNNQQQQAGQLGTAIQSGAFGGDRTGIAAANLEQQQNLANANIYSGILNTGYNNALQTAQQQQGVGLAAGQANRAALGAAGSELAGIGQTQFGEGITGANTVAGLGQTAYGEGANTANTLSGIGTAAQTAGLQGAQAQIGAGTLEQQTQQAQDTAQYNQFLQQQSYPFQVDQFLANIAEGTGALSGSTTTTQQPGGFFSDERLKEDMEPIGKTFDGQPIYRYKMKGDKRDQIGLSAQEVEKKHPSAVGVSGGYRWVDYGKATEDAANRGKFESGGVAAGRRAYAGGGPSVVDPSDLSAILQAQQSMYAPMSGGAGVYGGTSSSPRGGLAHVPPPSGATPHLVTAQTAGHDQPSPVQNMKTIADTSNSVMKLVNRFKDPELSPPPTPITTTTTPGGVPSESRGGRTGYDTGGGPYSGVAGGLDIPDDPSQRTLNPPQGAGKGTTGLQNVGLLAGTANSIADLVGLKRGGVAGRKGYADGGGDMMDDIEVDGQRPDPITSDAGVSLADMGPTVADAPDRPSLPVEKPEGLAAAAAPPPADKPAAKSDDGKTPWYKDSGKLVPLLTGLAAMGTAPTRSLGVALASGLGAGAQSYLPAQSEIAARQQTQAKTAGLGLQNEMQGMKNRAAAQYFNPQSGGAPAAPSPSDPAAPTTPAVLKSQYAVQPFLPDEVQRIKAAAAMGPEFRDAAMLDAKARAENQTYNNQKDAQIRHDAAYQTALTDPDPAKRAAAAKLVDMLHPWTGDMYEDKGGSYRNSRTGAKPIGQAIQDLTPEQLANLQIRKAEPVDYGANAKIPLDQYAAQHGNPLPPTPGTTGAQQQPNRPLIPSQPGSVASTPMVRPSAQQSLINDLHNPATASAFTPGASAPANAQTASAPNIQDDWSNAPKKPAFIDNPNVALSDDQKRVSSIYAEHEGKLIDEANSLPETQRAIINTQRILNTLPRAKTGPGTDVMSAMQTALGNMTGSQFSSWLDSNPSAHALLQKKLGTNALETTLDDLKSRGASVRLGQQESKLIIGTLSASTEMPKGAIKSLLDWQMQDAKWELARQQAIPKYLSQGNDARYFDNVYASPGHHPLSESLSTMPNADTAINKNAPVEGTTGMSKSGKPTIWRDGKWRYVKSP